MRNDEPIGPLRALNVGCGTDVRPGWVNKDLPEFDVGRRPWPWPDASFRRVYAGCVLPHLPPSGPGQEDPLHVAVTEAYRVLEPGGVLEVTGPDPRDVRSALAAVHHYRLIDPSTFIGYMGRDARHDGGGKRAAGGPFASMHVTWGDRGSHEHNVRDRQGRPLGVSRILPDILRLGAHKLGFFTHLFRRMRWTWLLRGEKIRILLTKPGGEAEC